MPKAQSNCQSPIELSKPNRNALTTQGNIYMHENIFYITGFKLLGRIIRGVWFIVVYPIGIQKHPIPETEICHEMSRLYDDQIK